MKRTTIAIITLTMVAFWTTKSFSGERELHGLLLGAGSGAILGQAIGGDSESTLIGSVIGGALGVAISGSHHNVEYRHYSGDRHYRSQHNKKWRRNNHRNQNNYQRCRYVKKTVYKNGHSYRVKKEICRDDRRYGYERERYSNRDRDHYRNYNQDYDRDYDRDYRRGDRKKDRKKDHRNNNKPQKLVKWNKPYNN